MRKTKPSQHMNNTGLEAQRPNPEGDHAAVAPVPRALRVSAAWSWRLLVVGAALGATLYLLAKVHLIVLSVMVAVLLAVLINPLASWLRTRARMNHTWAAITALATTFTLIIALVYLAGTSLVNGMGGLYDSAAAGLQEVVRWVSETKPLGITHETINKLIADSTAALKRNAGSVVNGVLFVTSSASSLFTGTLLALFTLFFLLKDGRGMWIWIVRLLPQAARKPAHEAALRGWYTVSAYTRTQVLVAVVDATGIGLGAWLLGVPLALPLAVLVFLGAFIPIVGALLTGSVAVLLALVDQGPIRALIMFLVVLGVQQIEGNVLQPWLMSNAVSLHPVIVVLTVVAGTALAGIVGAIFAVPLVAVINTVTLYLSGHDKYPNLATDPGRSGGAPGQLEAMIAQSYGESGTVSGETGTDETAAAPVSGDDGEEPESGAGA